MANKQIFNNTLIITGSVTASQGFYGDGSNVTGVISSSYATTSSYALFAVSSSHEITFEISSSHALKADQADSVAFEDITDKPTLISSSLQFDDLTSPFTGSFTGSFTGDGTNLTGLAAGNDTEVQLNNNGELGASSNLTYNNSTLSNSGDVKIDAGSNNTQALEITGSLNITGSQNISGSVTISDNLTVNGTTSLNGITILTPANVDLWDNAAIGTIFIYDNRLLIKS